ncbi:hypothetical protein UA08_06450 [Talaromyces atroroseus]|uniref:Uncharacterized protein n=1 Tax=Talaromyces atroroseus TaxID=1441469 RepID=A0A225ALM3_TALAT|nr:hypothetical protein UA08_06450 [Talaromyces atroroseus]OKL58148.1 hypothetical protein UA08_06450 [Talaromyces atroroseus]
MASVNPSVQQISLSLSRECNAIASATSASNSRLLRDLETVRDYVVPVFAPAKVPIPLDQRLSPFNVCITKEFAHDLESLHRLLDRALVDIVQRWFADKQSDFPSRMPLEKHEEDLLQWISTQEQLSSNIVPKFSERSGMWRTDFLIEGQTGQEKTKICEINARIPFNGLYMSGLHQEATKPFGAATRGFDIPTDFQVLPPPFHFTSISSPQWAEAEILCNMQNTKETIMNCFNRSKPLYHIHKKWPGVDSRLFALTYKEATGKDVVDIQPSQLQVEQDSSSPTGWTLYAKLQNADGESRAKIDQCAVELFQEEIGEIDPLVLKQLASCSVNDFRTILLLHDKRILGVVQQEIPNLIDRNVLSAVEGMALRNGIAETVIPGSSEARRLLEDAKQDPLAKNQYIIKPVRDASCNGIRFGEQMDQDDWLSFLERMASRALYPASDDDACVIQRLVDHARYDIVRHDVDVAKTEQFHLIGSCHMINSQTFVFGPWRIGDKVHVGLAPGAGGIVMSCVLRPADLNNLDGRKEE